MHSKMLSWQLWLAMYTEWLYILEPVDVMHDAWFQVMSMSLFTCSFCQVSLGLNTWKINWLENPVINSASSLQHPIKLLLRLGGISLTHPPTHPFIQSVIQFVWGIDWPSEWLTNLLADLLVDRIFMDWLVGWLPDWLTDCLSVRPSDWLTDWLTTDGPTNRLTDVGWLGGQTARESTHSLELIHRSTHPPTDISVHLISIHSFITPSFPLAHSFFLSLFSAISAVSITFSLGALQLVRGWLACSYEHPRCSWAPLSGLWSYFQPS